MENKFVIEIKPLSKKNQENTFGFCYEAIINNSKWLARSHYEAAAIIYNRTKIRMPGYETQEFE